LCRWAQFRQSIDEIESNVTALTSGQTVKYCNHIGGGYYVSVTSGFNCVDFRKFFIPHGETEVKPTRKGLALRLHEWSEMRKLVEKINNAYPALGTAVPCYMQGDHANPLGALECKECCPLM